MHFSGLVACVALCLLVRGGVAVSAVSCIWPPPSFHRDHASAVISLENCNLPGGDYLVDSDAFAGLFFTNVTGQHASVVVASSSSTAVRDFTMVFDGCNLKYSGNNSNAYIGVVMGDSDVQNVSITVHRSVLAALSLQGNAAAAAILMTSGSDVSHCRLYSSNSNIASTAQNVALSNAIMSQGNLLSARHVYVESSLCNLSAASGSGSPAAANAIQGSQVLGVDVTIVSRGSWIESYALGGGGAVSNGIQAMGNMTVQQCRIEASDRSVVKAESPGGGPGASSSFQSNGEFLSSESCSITSSFSDINATVQGGGAAAANSIQVVNGGATSAIRNTSLTTSHGRIVAATPGGGLSAANAIQTNGDLLSVHVRVQSTASHVSSWSPLDGGSDAAANALQANGDLFSMHNAISSDASHVNASAGGGGNAASNAVQANDLLSAFTTISTTLSNVSCTSTFNNAASSSFQAGRKASLTSSVVVSWLSTIACFVAKSTLQFPCLASSNSMQAFDAILLGENCTLNTSSSTISSVALGTGSRAASNAIQGHGGNVTDVAIGIYRQAAQQADLIEADGFFSAVSTVEGIDTCMNAWVDSNEPDVPRHACIAGCSCGPSGSSVSKV